MCGKYSIHIDLLENIAESTFGNKRFLISHHIRTYGDEKRYHEITRKIVEDIKNEDFPNPQEQADNLILWLGNNLKFPGETTEISTIPFQAIIGAISRAGVSFITKSLFSENLLDCKFFDAGDLVCSNATLTFKGWQRYDELKRQTTDSYKAFMAMSFDPKYDAVFEYFKEAVEKTGFELIRIDKSPKTGIIDNNMIVELRRARFIVTDCTGRNPGAYWEAGFAEGLGKKVFYTYSKEEFKEAHFDINHRFVIQWDIENISEAANELKSMIRAEILGAKMDD